MIEEKDLEEIPKKLKEAVLIYFKEPGKLEKKHKQNIYHGLYEKSSDAFRKIALKYENKAKLSDFYQKSDLFNREFDCSKKEECDEYLEGNCPHSVDCFEYVKGGKK